MSIIPTRRRYDARSDAMKNVLSRALYQVLAQRVFVYGNRTIIL